MGLFFKISRILYKEEGNLSYHLIYDDIEGCKQELVAKELVDKLNNLSKENRHNLANELMESIDYEKGNIDPDDKLTLEYAKKERAKKSRERSQKKKEEKLKLEQEQERKG